MEVKGLDEKDRWNKLGRWGGGAVTMMSTMTGFNELITSVDGGYAALRRDYWYMTSDEEGPVYDER